MIRSMTGFGDASSQVDGIHFSVELRSLNNKYFKATLRLPDPIAGLEAELESQLRKRLVRGSIVLNVRMMASDSAAALRVNDAALTQYLEHLETIQSKFRDRDQSLQIDLTALLALPGVLQPTEDEASLLRKARPVVADLVSRACDRLLAMREQEGALIAQDLIRQRDVILDRLEQIRQRAPMVVEEYHQRLKARIDELMARAKLAVDETDLIREVAIFADRADISEEISRISAHLVHFDQVLNSQNMEPAGRTLDFLAQELLREANTIASKSNDGQISRAIVDVKSAIDRIKEQVQNIE